MAQSEEVMINEENLYILTRAELKDKAASDFEDGDFVICGKYYIYIKNFKWGEKVRYPVSFFTTVNTRYDLRDLPISKQPQYIRDFIERYNKS